MAGKAPAAADRPARPADFRPFPARSDASWTARHLAVAPRHDRAPSRAIRLIDDTGHLLRAPEVLSKPETSALPPSAKHPPRDAGRRARTPLGQPLAPQQTAVSAPFPLSTVPTPNTSRQAWPTGKVCGCAARDRCRRPAIRLPDARRLADTRQWSYPQSALVASIQHSRPHADVSTELHRPAGPLTTVPFPGKASSIVWVERPAEAARLGQLARSRLRRRAARALARPARPYRGHRHAAGIPARRADRRAGGPRPRGAGRRGACTPSRRSAHKGSISASAMSPASIDAVASAGRPGDRDPGGQARSTPTPATASRTWMRAPCWSTPSIARSFRVCCRSSFCVAPACIWPMRARLPARLDEAGYEPFGAFAEADARPGRHALGRVQLEWTEEPALDFLVLSTFLRRTGIHFA